jgi:hypothetical protein
VNANFNGTSGNDNLTGTSSQDAFNVSQGGNDTIDAEGDDDTIFFGKTLNGDDRIDGGGGDDTLQVRGNKSLSAGYFMILNAASLDNVENIELQTAKGFSHYTLALDDANIAAGDTIDVFVDNPALKQDIFLDADFETDGHVNFTGGQGDDSVLMGPNVQTADRFDGADGTNFFTLHGNYAAGLTLDATTIRNFFEITFALGFSYDLTLHDATCAAGESLHVNAIDLSAGQSLTLDASGETDGALFVAGGAGNDTVVMGSSPLASEVDFSKGGNDTATGGTGREVFRMGGTFTAADRINGGTGAGVDTLDLTGN